MAGNLLERRASDRRSRSAFSSCHLDISCAPDQGSQCRQAVKALLITGQTLLTDPRRPGGLPDRYATRPKIKHGTAGDQLRALRTINSCVQDPSRPQLMRRRQGQRRRLECGHVVPVCGQVVRICSAQLPFNPMVYSSRQQPRAHGREAYQFGELNAASPSLGVHRYPEGARQRRLQRA
jgi:hypothetical protein